MPDGNMPKKPELDKKDQPEKEALRSESADTIRMETEAVLLTKQDEVFKKAIMDLANKRGWLDEDGRPVGIVDPNGKSLEEKIEALVLETASLLREPNNPEALPGHARAKLEQAVSQVDELLTQKDKSRILSLKAELGEMHAKASKERMQGRIESLTKLSTPTVVGAIKSYTDFFEEKITSMEKRLRDPMVQADYLIDFRRGGRLREDLKELIAGLVNGQKHASHLMDHCHSKPEFEYFTESGPKRREIAARKGQDKITVSEFEARLEHNHELRSEILDLANQGSDISQLAERIPALLRGQLDLLCNCTANQRHNTFSLDEYELGETDAESMNFMLDTLNQFLRALRDLQETKKIVSQLG